MIINSAKYSCAAGHEINEDSFLCSAEKGIFIVADGLGGHSDGEKASLAAVDYFNENYRGGCNNELISQLIEGANTEVLQKGDGGKTTVAAAFVENGYFHYANAGDSRVYYFRNGRIIEQTKDHSVCQASVDMGMIRPEDIRGNEDRSRLLKVLGSEEKLNIKKAYPPIKIQNGDAFLICSDGFWEYVYEAEMEADLLKSDSSEIWLKYMLKRHILRAENKGDNYTAVCGIIYFDGSEGFEVTSAPALTNAVNLKKIAPFAIAGTALIVAAIALSVFLRSGNYQETVLDITETNSVSQKTVIEAETTTVKTKKTTTDKTEKEITDLPEHIHVWDDNYQYDDVQHWKVCTDCNEADEKSDHTWDDGKVTAEPTETAEGVRTYTCTVCSATKTESIAQLNHTHTYSGAWTGSDTHHWHAATCGHANEMKDKAEHSWDSGTVTKAASCTETGVKTYKCNVCGHVKTETLPVTAHTFVNGKCSKCGETDSSYVPPHEHKFVNGKCNCGETDPNYVPPHEHKFVNGKCECGETDPNYVPPHEHKFADGKCECGETDPNYVHPHEHKFVNGKCECGETDPTYNASGSGNNDSNDSSKNEGAG